MTTHATEQRAFDTRVCAINNHMQCIHTWCLCDCHTVDTTNVTGYDATGATVGTITERDDATGNSAFVARAMDALRERGAVRFRVA